MILIKKNEEPKSLREYKSKGGTNYNDFKKDELRESSKLEFQQDIDNVLNLNTHIKRNRKKALDSYIEAYKRKNKGYSRETLIRERKRLLEKEKYIPYLGIILYKLDKKIRSKG